MGDGKVTSSNYSPFNLGQECSVDVAKAASEPLPVAGETSGSFELLRPWLVANVVESLATQAPLPLLANLGKFRDQLLTDDSKKNSFLIDDILNELEHYELAIQVDQMRQVLTAYADPLVKLGKVPLALQYGADFNQLEEAYLAGQYDKGEIGTTTPYNLELLKTSDLCWAFRQYVIALENSQLVSSGTDDQQIILTELVEAMSFLRGHGENGLLDANYHPVSREQVQKYLKRLQVFYEFMKYELAERERLYPKPVAKQKMELDEFKQFALQQIIQLEKYTQHLTTNLNEYVDSSMVPNFSGKNLGEVAKLLSEINTLLNQTNFTETHRLQVATLLNHVMHSKAIEVAANRLGAKQSFMVARNIVTGVYEFAKAAAIVGVSLGAGLSLSALVRLMAADTALAGSSLIRFLSFMGSGIGFTAVDVALGEPQGSEVDPMVPYERANSWFAVLGFAEKVMMNLAMLKFFGKYHQMSKLTHKIVWDGFLKNFALQVADNYLACSLWDFTHATYSAMRNAAFTHVLDETEILNKTFGMEALVQRFFMAPVFVLYGQITRPLELWLQRKEWAGLLKAKLKLQEVDLPKIQLPEAASDVSLRDGGSSHPARLGSKTAFYHSNDCRLQNQRIKKDILPHLKKQYRNLRKVHSEIVINESRVKQYVKLNLAMLEVHLAGLPSIERQMLELAIRIRRIDTAFKASQRYENIFIFDHGFVAVDGTMGLVVEGPTTLDNRILHAAKTPNHELKLISFDEVGTPQIVGVFVDESSDVNSIIARSFQWRQTLFQLYYQDKAYQCLVAKGSFIAAFDTEGRRYDLIEDAIEWKFQAVSDGSYHVIENAGMWFYYEGQVYDKNNFTLGARLAEQAGYFVHKQGSQEAFFIAQEGDTAGQVVKVKPEQMVFLPGIPASKDTPYVVVDFLSGMGPILTPAPKPEVLPALWQAGIKYTQLKNGYWRDENNKKTYKLVTDVSGQQKLVPLHGIVHDKLYLWGHHHGENYVTMAGKFANKLFYQVDPVTDEVTHVIYAADTGKDLAKPKLTEKIYTAIFREKYHLKRIDPNKLLRLFDLVTRQLEISTPELQATYAEIITMGKDRKFVIYLDKYGKTATLFILSSEGNLLSLPLGDLINWIHGTPTLVLGKEHLINIEGNIFEATLHEQYLVLVPKGNVSEGIYYDDVNVASLRRKLLLREGQVYSLIDWQPMKLGEYDTTSSPKTNNHSQLALLPLQDAINSVPRELLTFQGLQWGVHQKFSEAGRDYLLASPYQKNYQALENRESNILHLFEILSDGSLREIREGEFTWQDSYDVQKIMVRNGHIWDLLWLERRMQSGESWTVASCVGCDPSAMEPQYHLVFMREAQGLRALTLGESQNLLQQEHFATNQDPLIESNIASAVHCFSIHPRETVSFKPSYPMSLIKEHGHQQSNISDPIAMDVFEITSKDNLGNELKWEYLVPNWDDSLVKQAIQANYFLPLVNDITAFHHERFRFLLPGSEAGKVRRIVFLPVDYGEDAGIGGSYSDATGTVVFRGVKAQFSNEWLNKIGDSVIIHEIAGHGVERGNPYIEKLMRLAMVISGTTMDYGNQNFREFFAVGREYYELATHLRPYFEPFFTVVDMIKDALAQELTFYGPKDSKPDHSSITSADLRGTNQFLYQLAGFEKLADGIKTFVGEVQDTASKSGW